MLNLVVHIVSIGLYLISLLIICWPEQIMNSSLHNFTRVLVFFGPNTVFHTVLKRLHKYSCSMKYINKNISLLVKFPSLTWLVIVSIEVPKNVRSALSSFETYFGKDWRNPRKCNVCPDRDAKRCVLNTYQRNYSSTVWLLVHLVNMWLCHKNTNP